MYNVQSSFQLKQQHHDVSFVHSCGASCTFLEDSGIRCVERENAHVSGGLLFCHDLNNEVYLYTQSFFIVAITEV